MFSTSGFCWGVRSLFSSDSERIKIRLSHDVFHQNGNMWFFFPCYNDFFSRSHRCCRRFLANSPVARVFDLICLIFAVHSDHWLLFLFQRVRVAILFEAADVLLGPLCEGDLRTCVIGVGWPQTLRVLGRDWQGGAVGSVSSMTECRLGDHLVTSATRR